mgnify:CR=1 FL=1
MNADKLAERIVKEVGGKNNIKEMFHCVTRLRFYLKDRSVVDEERIKKLDGVLGVQFATDQLQIIIGNEVGTVYNAIINKVGFIMADDHRLWPKDAPEQPQQMPTPLPQKTWQKIGERMQTELDLRDKEAGEGADALKQQVKAANRSRRSYKDFLRRFCVMREEVKLDPDEFDLNFYTYGLSVYGNLPLIEPLETRESKKIEELALVIDTSYSTSGALVRAFLAETYTLLKGQENFFHRMNLHLIQADNAIRQDLLIRNEDELIHAMNHFELRGGGGTDFRPAFAYVDRLCAEKKFSNLRGLLYFTDGMGTYPAKRPAYDTAFLFLGERFDDANVPPWAMKVVLDEEEFTGAAARPASALADALAEEDDLYRDLNNS